MIDIACFTDPRFKDTFSQKKLEDVIRSAEEEAVNLADTTSLPPQESPAATADQEQATSTAPSAATRKKDKSLSCLLKKITSAKHQRVEAKDASPKERVKMEIKQYLSYAPIPSNSDPLAWWKTHVEELPLLSSVARKFPCIPATSVPSERVFGSSGHILSPHRSTLNPGKVNMLTS